MSAHIGLQQRQVMLCLLQGRHLLHLFFLLVLRDASHFPTLGQELEALAKAVMSPKHPRFALL